MHIKRGDTIKDGTGKIWVYIGNFSRGDGIRGAKVTTHVFGRASPDVWPASLITYSDTNLEEIAKKFPSLANKQSKNIGKRFRHVKRGTCYTIEATAQVQGTLTEGDIAILYRSETNDSLWVRRDDEFHDGRFAEILPRGEE